MLLFSLLMNNQSLNFKFCFLFILKKLLATGEGFTE